MPKLPGNPNLSSEYNFYSRVFQIYERDMTDFETHYQNAQQGRDNKNKDVNDIEAYFEKDTSEITAEDVNDFKVFMNKLASKNAEYNNGALEEREKKDFEILMEKMQEEIQSPLKKLLRTMILDTYATMAGNLDSVNADNKKNLDQVIALTELYDTILNEQDKKEIQAAFGAGEAGKFLMNADQDMSGNFSKTLSALYSKYRESNQTPEEKEKWKKLCNSYAVRPYMHAVSGKVKQKEKQQADDALPEAEKEKIQAERKERIEALKAEAKRLNYRDPEEFMGLSPAKRNEIRRAHAVASLDREEKQQREIEALDKELTATSERAVSVHQQFVDAPRKLARAAADFQLTTKDSVQFRQMYGALTKLGNTDGFRQMDQLLAEGNGKELIDNLNLAIQNTQNYITHANQKTFLQKGLLGSKRLTAAKNTLEELTGLSRMIQEEMGTLQDRWNKKERLEELKEELKETQKVKQELKPVTESVNVKETIAKLDPERRKISMVDLDNKVNGKKAVVSEKKDASSWVVVDHENEKQAGRGL